MQDVTFQETRCRNCRVGQERLLLLVDVNLFVIACNVCERSKEKSATPRNSALVAPMTAGLPSPVMTEDR